MRRAAAGQRRTGRPLLRLGASGRRRGRPPAAARSRRGGERSEPPLMIVKKVIKGRRVVRGGGEGGSPPEAPYRRCSVGTDEHRARRCRSRDRRLPDRISEGRRRRLDGDVGLMYYPLRRTNELTPRAAGCQRCRLPSSTLELGGYAGR